MNWAKLDPWFTIRMILHGWHPNSPLTHPMLTKRAFFSDRIPESYLLNFHSRICPYESFLWVMGMMRPFAKPEAILEQIDGWGSGEKLLVMSGTGDTLMTVPIMLRLAEFYRSAFSSLVRTAKVQVKIEEEEALDGQDGQDVKGRGVRFCLVTGAGHHLQNDVMWEVGAKKLLAFYEQL
jgi:hypothetical protein